MSSKSKRSGLPAPYWWLSFYDIIGDGDDSTDETHGAECACCGGRVGGGTVRLPIGVAIVTSHGDIGEAVQKAWDRRCNPGGEVRGERLPDIPPDSLPRQLTNRLLMDRAEIEAAKTAVRAAMIT
jgi:hypothetical protein